MYYMRINKNLVHQVGDQTKVILRCTVNQPSRYICLPLYSWSFYSIWSLFAMLNKFPVYVCFSLCPGHIQILPFMLIFTFSQFIASVNTAIKYNFIV